MRSRTRHLFFLIFSLSICLHHTGQAQITTFGEFNIHAGRLAQLGDVQSTLIAASGNFGLQFSVVAICVGAGPIFRIPDDQTGGSYETIGIQLPVGLRLRIPVHKELLVGGIEVFGASEGYGAHIGILFRGKWNYRGFFLSAGYDPKYPDEHYYGCGIKMTLPAL